MNKKINKIKEMLKKYFPQKILVQKVTKHCNEKKLFFSFEREKLLLTLNRLSSTPKKFPDLDCSFTGKELKKMRMSLQIIFVL
jgi:hypothetical protein